MDKDALKKVCKNLDCDNCPLDKFYRICGAIDKTTTHTLEYEIKKLKQELKKLEKELNK